MKKKLLACAMTLAMLLSLVPMATMATESSHSDHSGWTELTTDYIKALDSDSSGCGKVLPAGNYYLSNDLKIETRLYVRADKKVTFCLNGHTFTGRFEVHDSNADLTICSCTENGTICGSYCLINAEYGACVTLEGITINGNNCEQPIYSNESTLTIKNCTIKDCKNASNPTEYTSIFSTSDKILIENTKFIGNNIGIKATNKTDLTLKDVTFQDNTTDVNLLWSANMTFDGKTTVNNVLLDDSSEIKLAEGYQKGNEGRIEISLPDDASAPCTICDTYADYFVCTQSPYHIVNKNNKAVLETRIEAQPSSENGYTFSIDKNGASTVPLNDDQITYQWYQIIEKKLSECSAEKITCDSFYGYLNGADTNSLESGMLYVVGDVSGNSIISNSIWDDTYPQIILMYKNDSVAPNMCQFSSTADVMDLTTEGGKANGAVQFTSSGNIKFCYLVSAGDSLTMDNVVFPSATALEGNTATQLTDYKEGLIYQCVATLSDGTKIESDTIGLANTLTVTFDSKEGSKVSSATGLSSGDKVTKPADPIRDGFTFEGWYKDSEYTTAWNFDNDTVTENLTLYAKWTQNSTPSNSGGGSSNSTVSVPVSGDKDAVQVKATVSNGNATLKNITSDQIEAVDAEEPVTVDLSGLKKTVTSVTLPTTTFENVASSEAAGLTVKLSNGVDASLDKTAVNAITEQAEGKNIQLTITTGTKAEKTMTADQKETVKPMKNPLILDAYLLSNNVRISDFAGGVAAITVPYVTDLPVQVWFVAEDGGKEAVPSTSDGKTVTFTTGHNSHYVIAEVEESEDDPTTDPVSTTCPKDDTCVYAKFTDAETTAWYHDGVHFCVEQGYMNGVSDTKFAPSGTLSRGMIVTMLNRMEGTPVVNYAMSFADVEADEWYTEAIRWAQSTGLVSGYDEDTFGPNDSLTREQLATILYRLAESKGEGFVGASAFYFNPVDGADISDWASEAMRWCYMKGILTGDETGALNPTGNATRAEAATMLQRFCEAMEN